jgi:hypothetical protein
VCVCALCILLIPHSHATPYTFATEVWYSSSDTDVCMYLYLYIYINRICIYIFFYNEELNDLYSSHNIVRVIKSRRMRWAGHITRMGEERGVYRVLVGKPER